MRGGPKANELAEFVAGLGAREGLKTASFAARFPGSSTVWAEYLNGSKIIPIKTLGQVVQELCGIDVRLREQMLVRARKLHREATAEAARLPAADQEPQVAARELIDVQQHLVETKDRLIKATEFAESARATINTLLMMVARAENSFRQLTTEHDRGQALKRAETEARLDRARLRLERTEAELERARQHRYTAEQAQQALIIEAAEARRDLEELRRRAADLGRDVADTDRPEQVLLPAVRKAPGPGTDEDFTDFDDALDRITSEGEDRERDLIDLAEHTGTAVPEHPAGGPQIISGTAVPPPRPTPQPPARGDENPPSAGTASPPSTAPTPAGTDDPARPGAFRTMTEHRDPPAGSSPGADRASVTATAPSSRPHQRSPEQPRRPSSALRADPPSGLSRTTRKIPPTRGKRNPTGPLAADRIYLDPADTYEAAFVRDLADLLREARLPFAALRELAPSEAELSILLRGRPPSKSFIEALIKIAAPAELTTWQELWTATNRTPKAPRPPDAGVPRTPPAPSNGTDSRAALLTGWACAVLGVVFAYTVTVTFTAGLQADPGAGILNLIIYAVAALLSLLAAAIVLVGAILARLKSDAPFTFFLIAFVLALPAGLIVPWYVAFGEPWYWIADHLGVI
ncbi:hypothetical protein ABZ401_29530 [Streptomyces sp. NPDC005892]|uniref:hypothetical protein n=1 Tax=Streptomyces sp. NPDC005892 TaxID=3155593 RepID=UPI0033E0C430